MTTAPFHQSRRGFTLVEVLVATALLGFSLVVMFGFHAQAIRSNVMARKITDCSFLAKDRMDLLMAHLCDDDNSRIGTGLADGLSTTSSGSNDWLPLYHPMSGGGQPTAVNSLNEDDGSTTAGMPTASYYVTWQVVDSTGDDEWLQVWVRCSFEDSAFGNWHGQTISAYKFKDQG